MKRIIACIVAVSLASSVLFAQAAKLTGGVKTSWGVDLDTGVNGFKTEIEDLEIALDMPLAERTMSTGGADYYGKLTIGNIRVETDGAHGNDKYNLGDGDFTGSDARNIELAWIPLFLKINGITADLVLGDFNVGIYNWGVPTKNFVEIANIRNYGNANFFRNAYAYNIISGDYGVNNKTQAKADWANLDFSHFEPIDWKSTAPQGTGGLYGTYNREGLGSFSLGVSSNADWTVDASTDEEETAANQYLIGAQADINAVKNLFFRFQYATGLYEGETDQNLAATAQYNFSNDLFRLEPVAGVKVLLSPEDDENFYDVSFAGGVKFVAFETTLTAFYAQQLLEQGFDTENGNYTIALSSNLVPNATIQAAYEKSTYDAIHAKVTYDIYAGMAIVTPFAEFSTDNQADEDTFAQYVKGGVTIEGVLDNTTFSLDYNSNELSLEENLGAVSASIKVSF